MSQSKWILQELNGRGWVHLEGTQLLPQLARAVDEAKDRDYDQALAQGQIRDRGCSLNS